MDDNRRYQAAASLAQFAGQDSKDKSDHGREKPYRDVNHPKKNRHNERSDRDSGATNNSEITRSSSPYRSLN